MHVIPTILNVRGDETIERAIASEIVEDCDVPESFLEEMSIQYTPTPGRKSTVVEDLDEQNKD